MRIFRFQALALGLAVSALTGCETFDPALSSGLAVAALNAPRDEISRAVLGGGWQPRNALLAKRTSLTDQPLARGTLRKAVEQALSRAGYRREEQIVLGFPGAEAWSRLVVGACNEEIRVFVAFDASGKLLRAEGVAHEAGCL